MTIDTGSNGSITLPSKAFDQLHDISKQPVVSAPFSTAVGDVDMRKMRVADLEFAGLRYHGLTRKGV